MTVGRPLRGPSARVWRRVLIVSVVGMVFGIVTAVVGAWLGFNSPAPEFDIAHLVLVVGVVVTIPSAIVLGIAGTVYFRRRDREAIHRLVGTDVDLRSDDVPDVLTGRLLVPSDILRLDALKPVEAPVPAGDARSRPSRSWLWVLLVTVFGAILLIRLVLVAVASQDGGTAAGALGILVGGTVCVAGAPSAVLLALGAARNRNLRRLAPGALLIGSMRNPPLEFGMARLFPSTVDRIHYVLVWSFDAQGATLWQGAPTPRIVATIPRERITGIGLQEAAEMAGRSAWDRLVIVTSSDDGHDVVVPFLVRLLRSPWTLRNGDILTQLRTDIIAALGPGT